mgnify:CR=1 FL=1
MLQDDRAAAAHEAAQVAGICVRIMEEGDGSFDDITPEEVERVRLAPKDNRGRKTNA